ncbi:MAG: pyruvate, phosphate dikinase, partial [Candidatus Omnitrophica bacterium]|nr:pyruvate, phosphate dikinase [Candidatus Omnitrophota bacterium]
MMERRLVYFFGDGEANGTAKMKDLLGGKGANLAEMTSLGIPVPAGFTISTDVCTYYYKNGRKYPKELKKEVAKTLERIEEAMDAQFGDKDNPLLVSVRSGARVSMPGMMDTVLNLGLNDVTVKGIIKQTKNERFAYDAYRRFVQMYGDVVLGLKPQGKDEHDPFEVVMDRIKEKKGVKLDLELETGDLKELVSLYKKEIKKKTGKDFPEDPMEQLWGAIGAVFGSWNTERAIAYRQINNIPSEWGTAVNIQAMVYGNMGDTSGTGVAFTRDPASG